MRAEEPIILTSTKISDLTKTILAYLEFSEKWWKWIDGIECDKDQRATQSTATIAFEYKS